jgi:hypothetical protein
MNRPIATLIAALTIFASHAIAANFSGKWAITRAAGRGTTTTILLLNQSGNEITGEITPPRGVSTGSPAYTEVLGGKVEGDTVSFYLWTGFDKPVKAVYQGKLSGDEISFTITVDDRPTQATAKRVK